MFHLVNKVIIFIKIMRMNQKLFQNLFQLIY